MPKGDNYTTKKIENQISKSHSPLTRKAKSLVVSVCGIQVNTAFLAIY